MLFFIFCALSSHVFANADTIQNLQDSFRDQTALWFGPLQDIAIWTLLTLATISWAWSAAQMVLRNADFQEFVVELVRLVMFTGFFMALILNAQDWSSALIEGFMWSANRVSGSGIAPGYNLNPAGILERGFILSDQIVGAAGTLTYLAFAILALVGLAIYALIAAYTFVVFAEMYVVTAAGVLLLGFGGSQWTADYARRYLTYCVSIGAKLYVIFLVVGLGEQFIYNWAIGLDKSDLSTVLSILGVLIVLLILVKMIPDIIQGIITGASIGNATPTVWGMASAAGGVVAGAVAGTAGAAMAVREASKLSGTQLGGDVSSGFAGSSSNPSTRTAGSSINSFNIPLQMPSDFTTSSATHSGSSGGAFTHAGQTFKNLANAASSTLGGKITGDYGATHGSFGGSMAQKMRADRLSMAGGSQEAAGASGTPSSAMSGSIASAVGSAGGEGHGWVAQQGGFSGLSEADQEKAVLAHKEWQNSDPEKNTFDVESYVNDVQENHHRRTRYYSPAFQYDSIP